MKLISGGPCTQGDTCPALYDDDVRYVVQGNLIDAEAEGLELGAGEVAVSVPKELLDSLRK